jgi:hypothetical protein
VGLPKRNAEVNKQQSLHSTFISNTTLRHAADIPVYIIRLRNACMTIPLETLPSGDHVTNEEVLLRVNE